MMTLRWNVLDFVVVWMEERDSKELLYNNTRKYEDKNYYDDDDYDVMIRITM